MRTSAKRFSDFFLRLNQTEVEEIISLLQNFNTSLDTNVQNIDIAEDRPAALESVKHKAHTGKVLFRQAAMGKVYKGQILTISRLFPLYIIILGWTLGYAIYANDITKKLGTQQQQIEISLITLYNQNLFVTEFIEMIYSNSSTTVRNGDIEADFINNIKNNQNVASLVNSFRDSNGNLELIQEEVFYNFACSQFNDYNLENYNFIMTSCKDLGRGTNKVGLLNVITQLNTLLTDAYNSYSNSDKSIANLISLSSAVTPSLSSLSSVTQGLCTVLYEVAKESFTSQVSSARRSAIIFTVGTILGLLMGSVAIWYFLMSKIYEFESLDKRILQIVPVRTILANRYLKQYLIQNSTHEMQTMKHLLQ